jgi:hypothetical protein
MKSGIIEASIDDDILYMYAAKFSDNSYFWEETDSMYMYLALNRSTLVKERENLQYLQNCITVRVSDHSANRKNNKRYIDNILTPRLAINQWTNIEFDLNTEDVNESNEQFNIYCVSNKKWMRPLKGNLDNLNEYLKRLLTIDAKGKSGITYTKLVSIVEELKNG